MKNGVALITGCSSGIGRDIAETLSREGYTVVATARQTETLEGLTAALKLPLDVTDEISVSKAVDAALKAFGRIDVLVNNAGYAIRGAVEELPPDEVLKLFDVNVNGIIRMTHAVAPVMRKQGGGRIVNIGSIGGKLSMPVNGAYSSSKFAVEALTDSMRLELYPFGIETVLIEPGNIQTPFMQAAYDRSPILENPQSPYAALYRNYKALSAKLRKGEAAPHKVSKAVLKALSAKHPRARYRAAVPPATQLLIWMSDRLRDFLYRKTLSIRRSH